MSNELSDAPYASNAPSFEPSVSKHPFVSNEPSKALSASNGPLFEPLVPQHPSVSNELSKSPSTSIKHSSFPSVSNVPSVVPSISQEPSVSQHPSVSFQPSSSHVPTFSCTDPKESSTVNGCCQGNKTCECSVDHYSNRVPGAPKRSVCCDHYILDTRSQLDEA